MEHRGNQTVDEDDGEEEAELTNDDDGGGFVSLMLEHAPSVAQNAAAAALGHPSSMGQWCVRFQHGLDDILGDESGNEASESPWSGSVWLPHRRRSLTCTWGCRPAHAQESPWDSGVQGVDTDFTSELSWSTHLRASSEFSNGYDNSSRRPRPTISFCESWMRGRLWESQFTVEEPPAGAEAAEADSMDYEALHANNAQRNAGGSGGDDDAEEEEEAEDSGDSAEEVPTIDAEETTETQTAGNAAVGTASDDGAAAQIRYMLDEESQQHFLEVRESTIGEGEGVFAKKHIRARTWIGCYEGKILRSEAEAKDKVYLMENMEDGSYVDASESEHWSRFVADYRTIRLDNERRVAEIVVDKPAERRLNVVALPGSPFPLLVTTKWVRKGQELAMDYGSKYWKVGKPP